MSMFAAIRIRGDVNLSPGIRKTLELLRLHKVNHLVLVGEENKEMLVKVHGYVTWGEIEEKTLEALLEKRGRLQGNKRVGKEFLKKSKVKSFGEMAKTVLESKSSLEKLGIKPVFRLSPPKKGHMRKGIKAAYSIGGALGYRAADINELVRKMA